MYRCGETAAHATFPPNIESTSAFRKSKGLASLRWVFQEPFCELYCCPNVLSRFSLWEDLCMITWCCVHILLYVDLKKKLHAPYRNFRSLSHSAVQDIKLCEHISVRGTFSLSARAEMFDVSITPRLYRCFRSSPLYNSSVRRQKIEKNDQHLWHSPTVKTQYFPPGLLFIVLSHYTETSREE